MMKKRDFFSASVTEIVNVTDSWFLISLVYPGDVCPPAPGQFFMLRDPSWDIHPLLPRPISVYGYEPGVISFLIKKVGKGTHALALLQAGARVDLTGPLGNGFVPAKNIWLVAGGVGFPPLGFYRRIYGGRLFLGLPTINGQNPRILSECDHISTMDATGPFQGSVAQLVARHMEDSEKPSAVYSCGPQGMLTAIDDICRSRNIPHLVSLEEKMACGTGICHGCSFSGGENHVCVCTDGPVFDAREIWP
ncbi:hypothetical protein KKF34_06685 [Myxococcota bacterium]|nr:hypothetical protein [Myxococcota bacterium]MBU1381527.1 hypothetical protein [Myxococcota bacterium]MBU1496546.1 hypothetical protein [Myxococcota bacterium]